MTDKIRNIDRKDSQRLPSYFLRITKRLIKLIDVRPSSHQAVRKVLVRLKYSVPLSKAESEFAIVTEECLTFRTVSPAFGVALPHSAGTYKDKDC